jgi:hypothetical protein
VKFHNLQDVLRAILSGYKSAEGNDSGLEHLAIIEDWAMRWLTHSLDATERLSAKDGEALVKIIANNENPKQYQQ